MTQCRHNSTNMYGYPAHFDLQDADLQVRDWEISPSLSLSIYIYICIYIYIYIHVNNEGGPNRGHLKSL